MSTKTQVNDALSVMDIATNLFLKHGFAETAITDVARIAGISTRTIYEKFGNKETIFQNVLLHQTGAIQTCPPLAPGDTLFEALLRVGNYTYDVTYREEAISLMQLMVKESNRYPEFMQSVASSIFQHFHQNIEQAFHDLEKAGLIPAGDHARSADLFADTVLGCGPIMAYSSWSSERPNEADLIERLEFYIAGRFGSLSW
jgi:TetR/AcrR family transcriptional regulator, mexJK operon transcriptional repressor